MKNFNIIGEFTENPIFRKGMRGVLKIYLSKKGGGLDSFKI